MKHGQKARMNPSCIIQIRLSLPTSDLVLYFLVLYFLVLYFQRRPGSYCAKLARRIWSGQPGQVLAKWIWSRSKPVCKNHQVWFWQNAMGLLPVSHFQTQVHSSIDGPDHIAQTYPGSDFVLADCIRFQPNRSGPEATWCARITGPSSGQRFQPPSRSGQDANWISMFTA